MQAKRNFSPVYYLFTKKGWIIGTVLVLLVGVIVFSLPFNGLVKTGLFLAGVGLGFKGLSSQFPITEGDIRGSFLQKWWRKKWEAEKESCSKLRLTKALEKRYGKCR